MTWIESQIPILFTAITMLVAAVTFTVRTNSRAKSNTHRIGDLEIDSKAIQEKVAKHDAHYEHIVKGIDEIKQTLKESKDD